MADSNLHSASLRDEIPGRDDYESQQAGSEIAESETEKLEADSRHVEAYLAAAEHETARFEAAELEAAKTKQAEREKAELEAAIELAREYCLLDNDDHKQARIRAEMSDLGFEPSGFDGQFYGSLLSPVKRVESNRPSTTCACDACHILGGERFFCNVCNENYCDSCWKAQRVHISGKLTVDNIPHERTNYKIAQKIQACMEAEDDDDPQQLHKQDEHTTWFGVTKDAMDEPIFEDYGRYGTIITEGSAGSRENRYPGLVSFVGQTGAGKSTLIKILIELRNNALRNARSPVVGSVKRNVPTSGDVHLYCDPQTHFSNHPILYADCEGLEGGEREPQGAKSRHREKTHGEHNALFKRTKSFQQRVRKMHYGSQREITWANTAEKRTRDFAVTNLYPRLLYTFSDVIVFVLLNPRVIENAVERLIGWAASALEKSSNQPVLPHLIIALNASENSVPPDQWDVEYATRWLLSDDQQHILRNPKLQTYAKYWQNRDKSITSVEDLLLSYYYSVRVVRIPTKGRPKLISDQTSKLYNEITTACEQSRLQKRSLRMLLEADRLQPYLQYAFDHFSTTLDAPFDFVKVSFLHNPIPNNFGGNILKLAINMMDVWENRLDGEALFTELSALVASCIMLDSARHNILGDAVKIFREHFMDHCGDALEDFCDQHWPCEFVSAAGRCVNVKTGHNSKGHQLRSGKVFAAGSYESSFTSESFGDNWRSLIHYNLDALLKRLHESDNEIWPREQVASKIHQNSVLVPFFRHMAAVGRFRSHSTCYACLMAAPQHALPCGHVICTQCLQGFGTAQERVLVTIDSCPFGQAECFWPFPWSVAIKPPSAGVRILTLDGGGVRGLAELEMLKCIENALGSMPLQAFFDLIVGTSVGGIIALGLGVKNWDAGQCLQRCKAFWTNAFSPRMFHRVFGLAQLHALQQQFGSDYLFGGVQTQSHPAKVALTATSSPGLRTVVLSNYNRTCSEDEILRYTFQRPGKLEPELKIWEAARATSAAPTYFKSFSHEPSKQIYIDGGIYYNNPVEIADSERKLIWPDIADSHPDILLSVGSGVCNRNRDKTPQSRSPPSTNQRGVMSYVKHLYRIAVGHIESSLDSEQAWKAYIKLVNPSCDQKFRYQRLNLILEEAPPKLDDVDCLPKLEKSVKAQMRGNSKVIDIAHHLVASCFFFEKTSKVNMIHDGFAVCKGTFRCRFDLQLLMMKQFGELLLRHRTASHTPYFIIEEQHLEVHASQVILGPDVIEGMILRGEFHLDSLDIKVSNVHATTKISFRLGETGDWPISGFPRKLHLTDPSTSTRSRPGRKPSRSDRTPSQVYRRCKWLALPTTVGTEDNDMMSRFATSDYLVGDTTAAALNQMSKTLGLSPKEISSPISETPRDSSMLPEGSKGWSYFSRRNRKLPEGEGVPF